MITVAYVLNRMLFKSVAFTSYELWMDRKLDLSVLWPWSLVAYVYDPSHMYGKLGPMGKKCIFIKYSKHSKSYIFIGKNEDGSIIELESRGATFLENKFSSRGDVDKAMSFYEIADQ